MYLERCMMNSANFFVLVVGLSSTGVYGMKDTASIPVIPEDSTIVKKATYFKVHDDTRYSHCEKHIMGNYLWNNPADCPDKNMHMKDKLIVTYHNRDWLPIALVVNTKFASGTTSLYEFAKSRLDPAYKPMATKAAIVNCMKRGRVLEFKDATGELLCHRQHEGFAILTDQERNALEQELDLSQVKKIKDKTIAWRKLWKELWK